MRIGKIRKLRAAYFNEQESIEALAKAYRCSEATVKKFLANEAQGQPLTEDELAEVITALKKAPSLHEAGKRVALSKLPLKVLLMPYVERIKAETGVDLLAKPPPKVRFDRRRLLDMLESFDGGMTQAELATWHGVSPSRIAQLLKKAKGLN